MLRHAGESGAYSHEQRSQGARVVLSVARILSLSSEALLGDSFEPTCHRFVVAEWYANPAPREKFRWSRVTPMICVASRVTR